MIRPLFLQIEVYVSSCMKSGCSDRLGHTMLLTGASKPHSDCAGVCDGLSRKGPWLLADAPILTHLLKCIMGIEWHGLAYGLPHFCPIRPLDVADSPRSHSHTRQAQTMGNITFRDRPLSADSVENSRPGLAVHALSGENVIFARCYVKSESCTLCSKYGFQSQTRTFLS